MEMEFFPILPFDRVILYSGELYVGKLYSGVVDSLFSLLLSLITEIRSILKDFSRS